MTNQIHRLVYVSRNELADADQLTGALDQILAAARTRNPGLDVTGALMFNGGTFAQVLEGPLQNISDLFELIQRDSRHSDIVVVDISPIEERRFPHWSMGFRGEDTRAATELATYAETSGFDPEKLDGDRILDLLSDHLIDGERSLI